MINNEQQLEEFKTKLSNFIKEQGFTDVQISVIFNGSSSFPTAGESGWSGTARQTLLFEVKAVFDAFEASRSPANKE